jgi:hypothetical protein
LNRLFKGKGGGICREEIEPGPEAEGEEQAEAWAEAVVDVARAEADEAVVAGEALAVDSQPVPEVTAFVPTAAKERPISWELPVMSRNARNAAPP